MRPPPRSTASDGLLLGSKGGLILDSASAEQQHLLCGGALNAALGLQKHWPCPVCAAQHDRDVNAAMNSRAEGLRVLGMRGSSPATGEGPEGDARGVACAAQATRPATVGSLQRRSTVNREPAQRPVRAKPSRTLAGTVRRVGRAGR
jgi:hypothetical protein